MGADPGDLELLVKYDFLYDSSCMGNDRPYIERWAGWRSGNARALVLDDWPRFGWKIDGGGNVADPPNAPHLDHRVRAARAEGRHTRFTMHPEVIGRPYRLAALEQVIELIAAAGDVWFAPLEEVAGHTRPA